MDLSVVMPVFQNRDLTVEAVENLLLTEMVFELIVIDNACTDGTAEYLATKPITVIHNPVNLGIAPAISQGFKIATGGCLAFTCNDMVNHPGNYPKVVGLMKEHPEIWCATTKFTHKELPPDWWEQAERVVEEPAMFRVIGPPMPPHPPDDQMMGGWFVMSREGWINFGDFDMSLPDWYGDPDIWCRFRQLHHPVVQINVLIHHYESLTTGYVEGSNIANSFQAQAVFEAKWGSVQEVIDAYNANPGL